MKIISKKYFEQNAEFFSKEYLQGKIFIIPTDTIYGISCFYKSEKSIKKIHEIKKRSDKPFSIICPTKKFIENFCKIYYKHKNYLKNIDKKKLTLILKLKNKKSFSKFITLGRENLGVRIVTNFFQKFLRKTKFAVVATSVNITGKKHISQVKDVSQNISKNVDYFLDCGILKGEPSKIFDLTSGEIKRVR